MKSKWYLLTIMWIIKMYEANIHKLRTISVNSPGTIFNILIYRGMMNCQVKFLWPVWFAPGLVLPQLNWVSGYKVLLYHSCCLWNWLCCKEILLFVLICYLYSRKWIFIMFVYLLICIVCSFFILPLFNPFH